MKRIAILLIGFGIGCARSPWIKARTEYVDMKQLASVAVDTPDPKKDTAYWGERLFMRWDMASKSGLGALTIRIRLRDGSEKQIQKAIEGNSGTEQISLDSYEYNLNGGILSYKIELSIDGKVIASTSHRLWYEPITTERQYKEKN